MPDCARPPSTDLRWSSYYSTVRHAFGTVPIKQRFTIHYRLRYNVFVPDAGSSEHRHTLYAGADGVARVDWQVATGASISVQLSWKWGSGAVGTLALEDAGQHSVWDVVVEKVAGTSYWLFGDVIVPAS